MTQKSLYDLAMKQVSGLPCFVIRSGPGHPHAFHPFGGWRLKANVYLDGSVRLFSGEFGSRFFQPAPFHPGFERASLNFQDTSIDLDMNQLGAVLKTTRQLGIQMFEGSVQTRGGRVTMEVLLTDLDARCLLVRYRWEGPEEAPVLRLPLNVPHA